MPYIDPDSRFDLDEAVHYMLDALEDAGETNLDRAGPMNYAITRIITGLMESVSYRDICVMTGVLENVKQELYRRAAAGYEDAKIYQNGDVPEYIKYERDSNR
jgi:hypothetical protein